MPQNENYNLILALRNEGWNDQKINDLIAFIGTHKPSPTDSMGIKYDFGKKQDNASKDND